MKIKIAKLFWMAVTFFGTPICYIALIFYPYFFIIMLVVEIFCWGIKFFYHKERPVPFPRNYFYQKINANSFPSIHTARASVLATCAILLYPSFMLMVSGTIFVWLVGYSRIFLKKHYLVDVICGAFLGFGMTLLIFYFR